MMLQEIWHDVASAIGSALQIVTTQEFWDGVARGIFVFGTYGLMVWTYVSTSPFHLLLALCGILVLCVLDFLLTVSFEELAKFDWVMKLFSWSLFRVLVVLLITLLLGLLLLIIWCAVIMAQFLLSTYDRWWFVPVLLTLTWLLFVMRVRRLFAYGALEILVGVVAITSSISHAIGRPKQSDQSIALILAVLGGVYIVIRGLDNVDKSIKALAYYMQLTPAVPFTKPYLTVRTYMRLRVIWDRYITTREMSAWKVLKTAAVEWKTVEVERKGTKRSWEKVKDEWMKAKARRRRAKEKAEAAGVRPGWTRDVSSLLVLVFIFAAIAGAASFCQRFP